MKLHDHPFMEVVNYVLKGKMEADIYSHVASDVYTKQSYVLEEKSVKFIDGLRTKTDNLH